MKGEQERIDRRCFLKSVGAAGVGPVLARFGTAFGASKAWVDPEMSYIAGKKQKSKQPLRKLGKTNIWVPELSFGTLQVDFNSQLLLRKAVQDDLTFWDTAYSYQGGNCELGIGKFIKRNPEVRKKLFLATKASDTFTIKDVEDRLQTSLARMNTNYFDLYYLHTLKGPERLNNDLGDWAKSAKERGLIRYFGFTTHVNVVPILKVGVKFDWVDVVMIRYNFREMQRKDLNDAVDACYKANIGIVAMKVQGRGQVEKIETAADKKLTDHFIKSGSTAGQAKIKAVMSNDKISSACVGITTVKHLIEDLGAVVDPKKLTAEDLGVLREVAQESCDGYCAGCAEICDSVLAQTPYVSDVMRYLMYYDSYGERQTARQLFAEIPSDVRARLLKVDYGAAEALCPQRLAIGRLMAEAVGKLA
ncbi:MAG: aldo/keto reductase [Planctomycetota bacterium]|jgi:predicted aldo/keto reductase-like oxidoreductase